MSYNEDQFIISTMDKWSFSRINSFDNCPLEWHMNYVEDRRPKLTSAMAQFGSFIHHILELYAKGELEIFELSQYYQEHYSEWVTYYFPNNKYVNLADKYYQQGLDYLDNINMELDKYDILGIEKEIKFTVGNYNCIGYIDLLLQDKITKDITILDHKSASITILKSGKVSKKDREHFESFKKQLYLYAKPVLEEYGHVEFLKWNLFKEKRFIEIPFDKAEYNASLDWAEQTIKKIEAEEEWGVNAEMIKAIEENKYPPFYCMNLCAQRDVCSYKLALCESLKQEREFM